MIKNSTTILLLFLASNLYSSHPSWADGEIIEPSSHITHATLYRFYILAQIAPLLHDLQEVYSTHSLLPDTFYDNIPQGFEDKALTQVIENIKKVRSLIPFFRIFNRYKNYQLIENENINKELLDLIAYITHAFLELGTIKDDTKKRLISRLFNKNELLQGDVTEIIFRFYFLKTIESVVGHIVQNADPHLDTKSLSLGVEPHHQTINKVIDDIGKSGSIKAYCHLYEELRGCRYLSEFSLQHDFLLLTYLLLINIDKGSLLQSSDINLVKKLPIKKLLDAINFLELNIPCDLKADCPLNAHNYNDKMIKNIIESEFNCSETEFCNLVFRRYYFINRFSLMDTSPLVKKSSTKSVSKIRPLLSEWKKFKRYMFLLDQLFIDVFAEEVFLVSNSAHKDSSSLSNVSFDTPQYRAPQHSFSDVQVFIDINNVILRFYHIRRTEESVSKMASFQDLRISLEKNNEICFFNPIVQNCFKRIQKTGSLVPLLYLSKEFQLYCYINDEHFLKEYLALFSQCQLCVLDSFNKLSNIDEKKNIHDITVEERLDEIDQLYDQVLELEKINNQSSWLSYVAHSNIIKKLLYALGLIKL